MARRIVSYLASSGFLTLAVPAVSLACAVCLGSSGDYDPVTDAFNWSILFLMAMPYAIVGGIAGWVFFVYRRAARSRGMVGKKAPILRLAWSHKESEK